jgi:endonuclease/exonuclease/phosphatase (EEP) superfamily protein YafD
MSIGGGGATLIARAPGRLGEQAGARAEQTAPPRRWRRILPLVCFLYAGLVVLWQALRFTPVAHWWPFELFDIFGLLVYAPLAPLLVLTLLLADRRAGLWLLLPLAVLAWELAPLVLPRTTASATPPAIPVNGRPLRIITANLLVINQRVSAVSAVLRVERADVIALQELSPEMAEHLARELRAIYPYQLLEPSENPSGLGILSRYPFRSEVAGGDLPRPCFCQRVVIDVVGRDTTLVNVHPKTPEIRSTRLGRLPIPTGFDSDRTTRGIQTALADLNRRPGPLLVVGDFNTSDRQPLYRELGRELRDTYREVGWGLGYTFPVVSPRRLPVLPIIRIDYVLHDPSVTAWAARTGITPGSDHRYVAADLVLP